MNAAGAELAEAKSALSTARADFAARQEELRNFINDARERENAAKAEATKSDERCTDVAEESDTPRRAGGLMSWAASKAVGVYLGVARCAPQFAVQNCPLAPSAASCSRMYCRTCSRSNPTVDTAQPRAQKCSPEKFLSFPYDGLDCVILFIPHDGMYHAAIQDEAEAIREACEKRVFISNPMSLIPLLKAIRYVLDQERLNKSAEEISRVGAELYGEMGRFAESVAKIGDRLKSTVTAYNDAIPGLDRFIVAKSRKLRQLGSGKGSEGEVPDAIDLEPGPFSSRELRGSNLFLEESDTQLDGAAPVS